MEIELAYEKLLKEHNLTAADLPSDARIGIEAIQQILKATHLNEKAGRRVNEQRVTEKVKANDKWVVREILDFVGDKDTNTDPLPNKAADVIKDDINIAAPVAAAGSNPPADDAAPAASTSPVTKVEPTDGEKKAAKIDVEFEALLKAGKETITLEELKAHAKTAYDTIFDNYEKDGVNGVETTYYDLVETEKEIFTLKKK